MESRTTFVFNAKWYDAFKDFEPHIQLEIYNAIVLYATKCIEIELSPVAKMAFNFIKIDIDSNISKFDAKCTKLQEIGKKGGRPRKNESEQKEPKGFSENQKVFQETKRFSENHENENENENENIYPPIIPQMGEVSEKKILKLDLSNPNKEKEKSCAKKEKIAFDVFWDKYDKKVGDKEKLKKKWNNLSLEVQNKILEYIPKYIESQPEKKFRKNPETFFNQKSWEDEIITSSQVYKTNQMVYAKF